MKFAGQERFACEQAELFGRLTDMSFMSGCIPDVERVERTGPQGFACRVRPRFSFLTGSLTLEFEVREATANERLRVISRGKGLGGGLVVEVDLLLKGVEMQTDLEWAGTIVSREGLLKPVGAALIQGAAERVIESFWRRFRERLAAPDDRAQDMSG